MSDAVETEAVEPEAVVEAAPFALPEDYAQTVQGWDVPLEVLPEAVALYKGLQTEEGVIDNFVVLGQKLGFGIKELERLFADEPISPPQQAPATSPVPVTAEPEDPERLMTAAEVRQLVEQERTAYESKFTDFQAQQAQVQQQAFEARQAQTFAAIGEWFKANEITDDNAQAIIARLGEKTLDASADSYDPQVAIAALERGKEAYDKFVETEAEARLRKKALVTAAQPTAVGGAGGSAGEEESSAPKYETLGAGALDAAKKRVRQRFAQGD